MSKKMIQWLPIIGFVLTPLWKPDEESLVNTHFWVSAIWHAVWNAALLITLIIVLI